MQKIKQGFTLIELLVVVLIIGILAAVALPQYQKSVEKSRAAEALAMLKSMQQACEVIALEGNYSHFPNCGLGESALGRLLDFSSLTKVPYAWSTYCSKYFCYFGVDSALTATRCAVQNYVAGASACGASDNVMYTLKFTRSSNGVWTKTYTPSAGFNMNLDPYFESMGFTIH